MTAGRYDITIEQGATFDRTLTVTDSSGVAVNLAGYTAKMQGRKTHDATTATFTIDSTTAYGGITLTSASGTVRLVIGSTATASLVSGEMGVYDLELNLSGVVTRVIEGTYYVSPEVTR